MNPEALGPLGDRPLAETSGKVGPTDLFPGASKFLAARHQRRRLTQWDAVRPIVQKMLRPEEKVLYVAHAMQVPPVTHAIALRALALPFHQVVLTLTDTRVIEVMLDLRGRRAGTRVRSFAWAGVRDLKLRFARLTVTPGVGKKQSWRVPLRGDRRILDLLFVRLKPRLLTEGAAHAATVPLWHCPQCVAVVPPTPESCTSCRTRFTSRRLASLLSVAFPGAGLLYAGHPFLATMDFLGQAILYGVFVLLLLQAEPGRLSLAFGFGAFLFVMIKIHSIIMSRIMTARTRPESDTHRSGYGRFALIGGLMSAVLVGGTFPLAGKARVTLERDLDGPAAKAGWRGSRDRSEWTAFAKDKTARSQWYHDDGLRLTLFAYPQDLLRSPEDLHREFREVLRQEGTALLVDDDHVPAPFEGFRMITRVTTSNGEPISVINYFVVDAENHDVHQAVAAVREEDQAAADGMVRDFLSGAHFIPATAPTGVAADAPAAAAPAVAAPPR
jgi:hypothetical protein